MSDAAYIPSWAIDVFSGLETNSIDKNVSDFNKFMYTHFPEVNTRTVRRWTQAYLSGDYRTKLVTSHYHILPAVSIVPDIYSDEDVYTRQLKELYTRCNKEKRAIRIANIQDIHANNTDQGLLNLALQIVEDYEPDYVPYFGDWIDNTLLSTHPPTYYNKGVKLPEDTDGMLVFEELSLDLIKAFNSVTPEHTIRPYLLGNHEAWMFRQLMESQQFAVYAIHNYLTKVKKEGVLWVKGDQKKFLKITDMLWVSHGWLSRQGLGATANAYLRKLYYDICLILGHSHRMETIWSPPKPRTGEQVFVAVSGTLGNLRPEYTREDYLGHHWGFQLVNMPIKGSKGAEVEEVRIMQDGKFYVTRWRGKLYKEKVQREWAWYS